MELQLIISEAPIDCTRFSQPLSVAGWSFLCPSIPSIPEKIERLPYLVRAEFKADIITTILYNADILGFTNTITNELQKLENAITNNSNIPQSNVTTIATHVHNAPGCHFDCGFYCMFGSSQAPPQKEQLANGMEYVRQLYDLSKSGKTHTIKQVLKRSGNTPEKAFNLDRAFDGKAESNVTELIFINTKNETVLAVLHVSIHPIVLGPEPIITGDLIWSLRDIYHKKYTCPVLIFNLAEGNMAPNIDIFQQPDAVPRNNQGCDELARRIVDTLTEDIVILTDISSLRVTQSKTPRWNATRWFPGPANLIGSFESRYRVNSVLTSLSSEHSLTVKKLSPIKTMSSVKVNESKDDLINMQIEPFNLNESKQWQPLAKFARKLVYDGIKLVKGHDVTNLPKDIIVSGHYMFGMYYIFVPFELTTGASNYIIFELSKSASIDQKEICLVSVSNSYLGYMTSNEEFNKRTYEGASTFGGSKSCEELSIRCLAVLKRLVK